MRFTAFSALTIFAASALLLSTAGSVEASADGLVGLNSLTSTDARVASSDSSGKQSSSTKDDTDNDLPILGQVDADTLNEDDSLNDDDSDDMNNDVQRRGLPRHLDLPDEPDVKRPGHQRRAATRHLDEPDEPHDKKAGLQRRAISKNKDETDNKKAGLQRRGDSKHKGGNDKKNKGHEHQHKGGDDKHKGPNKGAGRNIVTDAAEMLTGHFAGDCSKPGSTKDRPNGSVQFLNCGINGGGWKPPHVTLDMLKVSQPDKAAHGTFKPCEKYLNDFKSVGKQTGIPPTMLMAFAMQESTCNAHLKGPNGEFGLMQITKENCKGDCWNVQNNIKLGAGIFKKYLHDNDNNVLMAIGAYNGWQKGLTKHKAMSQENGCWAQNNLDYIDAMVNGWLQGKDGYGKQFKTYNNLGRCEGH